MWRFALLLSACSFDPSVSAVASQQDASFAEQDAATQARGFRKAIRFKADIAAELPGFVVAIVIDSDADLAARSASTIAFVSETGTPLHFEIDSFNTETGNLIAWVKLPALLPGTTTIYLQYGGAESSLDPANTWSESFAAAWHFRENPAVDNPVFVNSAQASFPGTAAGDERPTASKGIVGSGLQFDGIDQSVTIADSAMSSLDFGMSSFSYSVWVLVEQSIGNFDIVWWKGASSTGSAGYNMELGRSTWRAHVGDGGGASTDHAGVNFGTEVDMLGRWVHLAAVVDREAGEFRAYTDGVLQDTVSISGLGSLSNPQDARVSRPAYPYKGYVDEVRVYKQALPSDWIASEYQNLSASLVPGRSFFELGAEEAL